MAGNEDDVLDRGVILLGMGNSLDYELRWDAAVLSRVAAECGIEEWPDVPARIRSRRDLLAAILAYSQAGVGTERAVDSVEAIESTAASFGYRTSLGGTGIRAARILRLLGLPCTVHLSSLGPQVRELLWDGMGILAAREHENSYPHLIVQFSRDAPVVVGGRPRTPPRANRLIFVNDPDNTELELSPDLPGAVRAASVWLISGFNAMLERAFLERRLERMQELVRGMRSSAWSLYEDGGFHDRRFADVALRAMARVCTVVGMNEDEFIGHLGRPVELQDPAAVGSALHECRERFGVRNLVVHTASWAAAAGPDAAALRSALRLGIDAGAARYALGDAMGGPDVTAMDARPRQADGLAVAAYLEDAGIAAEPGVDVACERPVTVGLGDSFVGGFTAGLYRAVFGQE